jgi:hypothetical protein
MGDFSATFRNAIYRGVMANMAGRIGAAYAQ